MGEPLVLETVTITSGAEPEVQIRIGTTVQLQGPTHIKERLALHLVPIVVRIITGAELKIVGTSAHQGAKDKGNRPDVPNSDSLCRTDVCKIKDVCKMKK